MSNKKQTTAQVIESASSEDLAEVIQTEMDAVFLNGSKADHLEYAHRLGLDDTYIARKIRKL